MGTWTSPSTIENLSALAAIIKQGPLRASDAIAKMEGYVGDDRMYETIDNLIDLGEGETDVRSLVLDFLSRLQDHLENDHLAFKISKETAKRLDLGRSLRSGLMFEDGFLEYLQEVRSDLGTIPITRIDEDEVYERLKVVSSGQAQTATIH